MDVEWNTCTRKAKYIGHEYHLGICWLVTFPVGAVHQRVKQFIEGTKGDE